MIRTVDTHARVNRSDIGRELGAIDKLIMETRWKEDPKVPSRDEMEVILSAARDSGLGSSEESDDVDVEDVRCQRVCHRSDSIARFCSKPT